MRQALAYKRKFQSKFKHSVANLRIFYARNLRLKSRTDKKIGFIPSVKCFIVMTTEC